MPKLLLKFNDAAVREIPLDRECLSVGRKPDNDIVIDDPAISGHHCQISLQGEVYHIEDLESTNGTTVNGKGIKKAGLRDNDVVGIARHSLVFMEGAPPEDAPAPEPEPASEAATASPPRESTALAAPERPPAVKVGVLRILKGVVAAPEYELTAMSTYIGKSDKVEIPIKGTGLFGSAPKVAAAIHRKPEGYVLEAVTEGYPAVNGKKVAGSVVLNEGYLIDCGATVMQFVLRELPPAF